MVTGIGIDIIETVRMAEKISKKNGFAKHVFSASEIKYCESQKNKAEHYAGRFAAKEALLKALGTGLSGNFTLNEIEVRHDEMGKPSFYFTGTTRQAIKKRRISKIHLSISHQKSVACAVVVIE